jgi:hypothetical protein
MTKLHMHFRPFCASLSVFLLALISEFDQHLSGTLAFLLGVPVIPLLVFGCWEVVNNATSTELSEVKKVIVFERWFIPSVMMLLFTFFYQILGGSAVPLLSWVVMLLFQIGLTLWFSLRQNREKQYSTKLDARQHGDQLWRPCYERLRRQD